MADPSVVDDGRVLLCLRGRTAAAAEAATQGDPELSWTPVVDATRITWYLDTEPPIGAFQEVFEDTVIFALDLAGGQRVRYRHKSGPVDEVDCQDPDGYIDPLFDRIFLRVEVPPGGSARVCALAEDLAGNVQRVEEATEVVLPLEPLDDEEDGGKEDAVDGGGFGRGDDEGAAGCRIGAPPTRASWLLMLLVPWLRRRVSRRGPSRA